MPLIKIDIHSGVDPLDRRFQETMDDFLHAPICFIGNRRGWVVPMDISEGEEDLVVVAEVAGVDKEGLRVVLEGEWLQISGRRRVPFPTHARRFFQVEIEYGPFQRVVRLPVAVDPDSASALYEDGLLVIRFRKRHRPAPAIKIEVQEEG